MQTSNTRIRYGTVAMALHWLIAALLITNLYLGLTFDDYPRGDPTLLQMVTLHKDIGLTVLTLSILRLVWRLMNPVPALPAGMNPLLRFAARATHWLLYFIIIFLPLSGWAMVSSSRLAAPIPYFGLFNWPLLGFISNMAPDQKKPIHHMLDGVHSYLAWTAIALIVIHVCGALYHQFFYKDTVLKRMIPGTKVEDHA
jgi:cytochrome b561